MSGGSGKTKTEYKWSPEQSQMWSALQPMFSGMAGQGASQLGQPNMGMPQAPNMPSMSGVLSGAGTYNIPGYGIQGYNVPSTQGIMPTQGWWNSLSPEVKAGAWAPFAEGQNQLMETLGGSGISGSARGGYSGAAGAALGQYMADATPAYAMNLWNMSAPGAMAGWQGQLGQNQYMANMGNERNQWTAQNQLARNQLGFQNTLKERSMDYQNNMNTLNQNYQNQVNAWAMPYSLVGMMPNMLPQGITTQPQKANWMGGLGGGMMGGMMGNMAGGGWNTALGAGGGFLGGLGK